MNDNITLPRKHIDYAAHALEHFNKDAPDPLVSEIIHHLRTALAAEQPKTPAWWRDGLAATLMLEGVNKHRAREIAVGYWEAYCQIPGNKEDET